MRNGTYIRIWPALAVVALLSACEKESAIPGGSTGTTGGSASRDGNPADGNSGEGETNPVATATGGNVDELDRVLTCWGLTNRAYFLHLAVKDGKGNLPNPHPSIYRAWSNTAATIANSAGMTLSEYQARQRAAQQAATTNSVKVDAKHAAAVQSCIDTAPALGPDPELTWRD